MKNITTLTILIAMAALVGYGTASAVRMIHESGYREGFTAGQNALKAPSEQTATNTGHFPLYQAREEGDRIVFDLRMPSGEIRRNALQR